MALKVSANARISMGTLASGKRSESRSADTDAARRVISRNGRNPREVATQPRAAVTRAANTMAMARIRLNLTMNNR